MVETFIFYSRTWKAAIKRLSLEQRGFLLTAIINSSLGEAEPEMDPAVACAFDVLLSRIQEDKIKYEETCEKRRAAGKKGGKAKAQNVANVASASFATNTKQEEASLANVASASFAKQENFCNPDNDHDNDHDNENDNDHENDNDPSNEGIKNTTMGAEAPKPVKGPSLPRKNCRPDDFAQWYAAYPKKKAREDAVNAWEKAVKDNALPDLATLLSALEWQKQTSEWQKGYICNPKKYLDGRRWQDEKPAPYVPPTQNQPHTTPQQPGYVPFTNKAMELIDVHNANQQVVREVLAEMKAEEESKKQKALGGQI